MRGGQKRSMQNTSCSRSCEDDCRTREIELFGKRLRVKSQVCSPDGIHYTQKAQPIRLQLSISLTNICPAACPFCVAGKPGAPWKLDLGKLERAMLELKKRELVRGVKITGGEPFSDPVLLDEVVELLFSVFGLSLELSISTNGYRLAEMHRLRHLDRLETIHVSRHHYDDGHNRAIFGGGPVPTGAELREIVSSVSYRDLFVFNCMLLRDHINAPEEAHRILDFALETGVPKVCFMTCIPCNDYAREQSIPYETVIRRDDPALLFTRHFYDHEACHCSDGIYLSPGGGLVEFYGRSTARHCDYCRGFSYEAGDHLLAGYGGEILL